MKTIYAINASPRKKWNTASLLQAALDGASAAADNVHTEMIHLYDYAYTGCRSCFMCKKIGSKAYGKCAVQDGITPVLEKLVAADAILFGSPIYFGDVTGMMRSLQERLLFPNFAYDPKNISLAPKPVKLGFIYTMNVPEKMMNSWGYPTVLNRIQDIAGTVFKNTPEVLYACNTVQFSDYSKYLNKMFDGAAKNKYKEEHWGETCTKAAALGASLV